MFPIRLAGLCFRPAGRAVLDGLDLELDGAGISIVLGPNGAGKTVLLRMLSGLLAPHAGRIDWGGGVPPRFGVAMVFQQPMILRASLLDNVAIALKPRAVARAARRARAREALEWVGLGERAGEEARHLSGGETQRLALARAWVTQPRLLLLDEPTASLDPSAVEAVERIVRTIRTDGAKVVMTTHNLAQASRLADDVVFLAGGKVREHAPVQRFFAHPASEEARQFIKGELPWSIAL
jgi:tungstate transport system ATP-binding protein